MPQPLTQNPYSILGTTFVDGLDALIAALPPSPTVDILADIIAEGVITNFYPTATLAMEVEILSVAYNAVNSYRNNLVLSGLATYNSRQAPFIEMLIGRSMARITPDSVLDRIADIEDNIGTSDLTVNEQTPLFMATAAGSIIYAYWANQIATVGPWSIYFPGNHAAQYLDSLQWTIAAMNGALAGYGANTYGLIEPTTNMVTTKMVSAFMGGGIATTGKVIFNWIPRITKPMQFITGP